MPQITDKPSTKRRRLALLSGLGVAAGCAVVALLLVYLQSDGITGRSAGTASPWTSGQFKLFATLVVLSTLLLGVLSGWLVHRARRPGRPRPGPEDGTAIIEFALIFPLLLMVALLLAQSSLLMGGFLCVNYASYTAARSAVVMVPQDLSDEPRNFVDLLAPGNSEKLDHIHLAAVWAVLPIGDGSYDAGSAYGAALSENLAELYSQYGREPPRWTGQRIAAKLAYAEEHTSVVLSPPTDPETLLDTGEGLLQVYAPNEDLTVRVRHDLYLAIPYADRILARLDDDHAIELPDGKVALWVEIPCTLRNEGVRDTIDIESEPDVD